MHGEQRVQRIDADESTAEPSDAPDRFPKIREIADAPVAPRADAIELDRHPPAAAVVFEKIRPERPPWHDDERHLLDARNLRARDIELEPVVADRQAAGHRERAASLAGDLAFGHTASLLDHAPARRRSERLLRPADLDLNRRLVLAHHEDRREQPLRLSALAQDERRLSRGIVLGRIA